MNVAISALRYAFIASPPRGATKRDGSSSASTSQGRALPSGSVSSAARWRRDARDVDRAFEHDRRVAGVPNSSAGLRVAQRVDELDQRRAAGAVFEVFGGDRVARHPHLDEQPVDDAAQRFALGGELAGNVAVEADERRSAAACESRTRA